VGDPFQQSHDFEPGIKPSGLFWTIPIAPSTIKVNTSTGQARLHASNVVVGDFHDFFNTVSGPPFPIPPKPSHVTFDVRWAGGSPASHIDDSTFGFVGDFVKSPATIDFTVWHDQTPFLKARSDKGGQVSFDAGVGRERNGVFYT